MANSVNKPCPKCKMFHLEQPHKKLIVCRNCGFGQDARDFRDGKAPQQKGRRNRLEEARALERLLRIT